MIRALELTRGRRLGPAKPLEQINRPRLDRADGVPTVLENAELLLRYAADNGLTVDAKARLVIFAARQEYVDDILKPQRIAELYAAYTALAVASHPVTAETIRACQAQSDGTLKRYQRRVLLLTAFVISLGVISFVSSSITQKISDDITSANALAVKLGAQLGVLPNPQSIFDNSADTGRAPANPRVQPSVARTPAAATDQGLPPGVVASDVIAELQQFTTQIRDVYRRAVSLNAFLPIEHDPFSAKKAKHPEVFWQAFQLPTKIDDFRQITANQIYLYQQVRAFGNDVQFDQTMFYGVIGAYLLPVLYALLGAFAYGLRKFGADIRSMTYHPSQANSARLVTAAICGAIVGLFNNFWQGISLPPLAIAFLVGYGVEVFFTFLDKLLQTFGAAGPAPGQSGPANSGSTTSNEPRQSLPAPLTAATEP